MSDLDEKMITPSELIDEMEKRCIQERGLVVINVGQWQAITEAYHSPLVERIADSAMSVYPVRAVETKELSFLIYTRKVVHFRSPRVEKKQ